MLRSHLNDGALAAAKGWSHEAVEPRHVGYAIARHFRERPEVAVLQAQARAALEPRGTSVRVPVVSDEARALLDSITSDADAVTALHDMLGEAPPSEAHTGTPHDGAAQAVDAPAADAQVASGAMASAHAPETVADVLAELDALVGLATVKAQVRQVVAVVQANRARIDAGLTPVNPGLHLVFTGPPGTGKTTVARLVARLYAASGALPGSRFTEVDRSDLVAGYVGQTAMKTADVLRRTRPGVLFVDEAYSLTPSHASDFGAEAIATLVKAMEDHRDDLAVIVAGYREEMTHFVESNPGLRSRLKTFVAFPDYAPGELGRIFTGFVESAGLSLADGALEKAEALFEEAIGRADFGNARFARSLFEQAYARMALRAAADGTIDVAELTELQPDDVRGGDDGPSSARPSIGFGG
jgi:Cdc6-like AAA superfamily ATPase